MKRSLFDVLNLAVLAAVMLLALASYATVVPGTCLRKFSSYDELVAFVKASMEREYSFSADQAYVLKLQGGDRGSSDYSSTNVQVQGVDEADIAKTDGERIYVAFHDKVYIVQAYPPEEARLLSSIRVSGHVLGLFVNGNKLVVLAIGYGGIQLSGTSVIVSRTILLVYDVSNAEYPVLDRSVAVSGMYLSSRMIGDYVYLVTNMPAAYYENSELIVALPSLCVDGEAKDVEASEVYYSTVHSSYYSYITVVAVNVRSEEEPSYLSVLAGASTCMYVSKKNMYLASPVFACSFLGGSDKMELHKILLEDGSISYVASGSVPGRVLNQFSMDEYQGYLRVATTTGRVARSFERSTSANHIFVLDEQLRIVGRLENVAPGERIYAARFLGERCYLVTFKKVDPFFVISLEDPLRPEVLGWLKIPGYSDYLHPYGENYVIGIGKETVEAEEGDFAWYQGVKVSMFNVTDVSHPVELSKIVIGDRGTDSEALRDHKALLFDERKHLMAMPILLALREGCEECPPNTPGRLVWQGLYVFNVSERGVVLVGNVTHLPEGASDDLFQYSEYFVRRALYIGSVLYTVSEAMVKMNDLYTLAELGTVELR